MSEPLTDPSDRAREPIHVPGAIQPLGALVALVRSGPRIPRHAADAEAVMPDGLRLNLLLDGMMCTVRHQAAVAEVERRIDPAPMVGIVRDNGIGPGHRDVSKLPGVFQCLYQAEQFEGIGIGLPLSRRTIGSHDGWIKAEVLRDQGVLPALPRNHDRGRRCPAREAHPRKRTSQSYAGPGHVPGRSRPACAGDLFRA